MELVAVESINAIFQPLTLAFTTLLSEEIISVPSDSEAAREDVTILMFTLARIQV